MAAGFRARLGRRATLLTVDLILVRHGETDANRARRFQGQIDTPLNTAGLAQAARLPARLASEGIAAIVSSDLQRAQQTAAPVAEALALPVVATPSLREQSFGAVDGLRVADIQRDFPADWSRWTQFHAAFAFAGGESTQAFHDRVLAALRLLAAQHAGRTLLVVTHGGVLDMVFRSARALSLDGPRMAEIPNAGINRVRFREACDGALAPEIVTWADTAHLGGLPAQPVYDQARLAHEGAPPDVPEVPAPA